MTEKPKEVPTHYLGEVNMVLARPDPKPKEEKKEKSDV